LFRSHLPLKIIWPAKPLAPKIPTLLPVEKSYLTVLKLVYNQVIAITNKFCIYLEKRGKKKKNTDAKHKSIWQEKERVRDLEKDLTTCYIVVFMKEMMGKKWQ